MFKKFVLPLTLALLAALLVFGAAFAQGNPPNRPGADRQRVQRGAGQIIAIGDDQFTVIRLNGEEATLQVVERTKFFFTDGSEASFSDLEIGRWVAGGVRPGVGGAVALRVIIFPEGFDPTLAERRVAGEVAATGSDSFTVETRKGETLTILVNAATIFVGDVQSLAEMEPGMKAAAAVQDENGALTAVTLGARFPVIRRGGEITAIGDATLTIETRKGETLTFTVDGETQFLSRDGSVNGLADLQTGSIAIVSARQLEDGSYLAVRIAAGKR